MKILRARECRGNWATLLLVWNGDESLDLGRVGAEIDVLIDAGVSGIYSCGTAGEFHTLSEDEFDAVSTLLADRCEAAGMHFQIGVSHMSAQISRERLRRTVRLNPSAVQLILPDWFPVNDEEAVRFLSEMADVSEGIGLVLYNPPHAKRVLSPAEIGRLADAVPSLVGVKVADGDAVWYEAMEPVFERLSVFVPGHHLATGYQYGASGAYSNVACLSPRGAQWWWELMERDIDAALEVESRIRKFMNEHIVPFIMRDRYSNGACDRLLAMIGGWADVGADMRWPYQAIPMGEAERLRPVARETLPEFFV